MRRRELLAVTAGGLGFGGCLSRRGNGSGAGTTGFPTSKTTATAVRRTALDVEAAFRIVDGHRPTDASATASFDGAQVVVKGTMDPGGCREPILRSVDYDRTTHTVRLVIGTESPYGPTANVECGNASYDYRCTVVVENGTPSAVEVVHAHQERENRLFVLEKN